jgi:hypothetical protein
MEFLDFIWAYVMLKYICCIIYVPQLCTFLDGRTKSSIVLLHAAPY